MHSLGHSKKDRVCSPTSNILPAAVQVQSVCGLWWSSFWCVVPVQLFFSSLVFRIGCTQCFLFLFSISDRTRQSSSLFDDSIFSLYCEFFTMNRKINALDSVCKVSVCTFFFFPDHGSERRIRKKRTQCAKAFSPNLDQYGVLHPKPVIFS